MKPSNAETTSTPAGQGGLPADTLIFLIIELEAILKRMDELGLNLAANHVSQGLELIRHEVESIQSGPT